MNGRRAKALRREARSRCVGMPERNYRRKLVKDRSGHPTPANVVLGVCERGMYQLLKSGRAA